MPRGTQRSHGDGPGIANISIAIPKELLDQIERIAKADYRPRNNWIVKALTIAVDDYKEAQTI